MRVNIHSEAEVNKLIESRLLAVSAKIAPILATMSDPAEIETLIKREFEQALDQIEVDLAPRKPLKLTKA